MAGETKPTRMSELKPGDRFCVKKQWDQQGRSAPEHMKLFNGCKDPKGQDANAAEITGARPGTLVKVPDEIEVLRVRVL